MTLLQSTETSTESSTEEATETPAPSSFEDTDSFVWLKENNDGAVIDLVDASDVAGNSTAKIKIGNKAIFKEVNVESGKFTFSTDFLVNSRDDSAYSGRAFRIYFEASTSLIAREPLALKQIRIVRTASADVYFDNVKLETK